VFYLDIAKVDPGCFKPMFKVFQLFQTHVSSVFILMLHIFAMVAHAYFRYLFSCVLDILDLRCKSESGCCICCLGYTCMFKSIFQMFHLF
jgi:hypothetical protein